MAGALRRLLHRHAYLNHTSSTGSDISSCPPSHISDLVSTEAATKKACRDKPLPEAFHACNTPEGCLLAGHVEIGTRRGIAICVEVTSLSGVAFTGPAAHDVVRAIIAEVLLGSTTGEAELLMTTELAERLLPGLGPNRMVRTSKGDADLVRGVHAELIAQARRLDSPGPLDNAGSDPVRPEHPLPLLLVVLEQVPEDLLARWTALLTKTSAHRIAVLILGESPLAVGRVTTGAARLVIGAAPEESAVRLVGTSLFAMGPGETVDVLRSALDG